MSQFMSRTHGRRACAVAWLISGLCLSRSGNGQSTAAGAEPRLRIIDYNPNLILPLTGFVGYHIHFEFAPDEHFVTLASGDTASLDVGAEGNHLLLKPKRATPDTNLTVLTNRRAYFIDFRALARVPRPEEVVYSVTFRYPSDETAARRPKADLALGEDLARPPAAINHNYWFCGSAALRPASVDDDGMQVRFTFPPHAELPAIYATASGAGETLVNSHVEDDAVVVHRLASRFVLRRGKAVACVVNRSFESPSRRAASGTISTEIDRKTRGAEP
jgi:type IV secretion system protein VirB9